MFEKSLEAKLKTIFSLKRVRFDHPGEEHEQETLFVEVDKSSNRIRDGVFHSKVEGKIYFFCQADKFPFGFFSKAIDEHPDETKDLFFFDFEGNQRLYENIVQRSVSFVYFFSSQYDPALGTINSVSIEVQT